MSYTYFELSWGYFLWQLFVGIIEVLLNLTIVYFLSIGDFDKLKFYAVLVLIVRVIVAIIYRTYCIRKYKECRYIFQWDKTLYKSIASFSGWSLIGSFSWVLLLQGSNILLNLFFGPVVNASHAISTQVNSAINLFVRNFQTASRPQMVKLYADNRISEMKALIINSTKFSYFLLLLIALPIILEAETILGVWLKQVPDYALIFVQLVLIDALVTVFDSSLYMVFNAMGRLKENATISPIFGFIVLPISYLLFKLGYPPQIILFVQIVKSTIMSLIVKPILLYKYANYNLKDFVKIFFPCIVVTILAILPPLFCHRAITVGWERLIIVGLVSVTSVTVSVFFIGINKTTRKKTINLIKNKIFSNG